MISFAAVAALRRMFAARPPEIAFLIMRRTLHFAVDVGVDLAEFAVEVGAAAFGGVEKFGVFAGLFGGDSASVERSSAAG